MYGQGNGNGDGGELTCVLGQLLQPSTFASVHPIHFHNCTHRRRVSVCVYVAVAATGATQLELVVVVYAMYAFVCVDACLGASSSSARWHSFVTPYRIELPCASLPWRPGETGSCIRKGRVLCNGVCNIQSNLPLAERHVHVIWSAFVKSYMNKLLKLF